MNDGSAMDGVGQRAAWRRAAGHLWATLTAPPPLPWRHRVWYTAQAGAIGLLAWPYVGGLLGRLLGYPDVLSALVTTLAFTAVSLRVRRLGNAEEFAAFRARYLRGCGAVFIVVLLGMMVVARL